MNVTSSLSSLKLTTHIKNNENKIHIVSGLGGIMSTAPELFTKCVNAIRDGRLIRRESSTDKEFHFQNWIEARLEECGNNFELGGRNSYPDFRMVASTEGFEIKGLAYPGREMNFDSNSQVPTGLHNGRVIYYVFGRYPAEPDENTYPVLDLVICHGDFLNADHDYVHKNKNIKGFGSYGDIMIRDRKMYVVPTPFGITEGTAHQQTLIMPSDVEMPREFKQVGNLVRKEANALVVGYKFDLRSNELIPETIPNPDAGREHSFCAWRLRDSSDEPVSMREFRGEMNESATEDDEE